MAGKDLNKIFLSAGIPYKAEDRESKYFETADIIAIRDSVKALATVAIPNAHLIWGGQTAITPLIRFVMEKMKSDLKSHVTLYQSLYFENIFPEDNFYFEKIILTEKQGSKKQSLIEMRTRMFSEHKFSAGIFIGGMDGVEEEYKMFKKYQPNAILLPIASTGAAAKFIYEENIYDNEGLLTDYAYMALFRKLLSVIL